MACLSHTRPLRSEDSLASIAAREQLDPTFLQRYNPGVNFSQMSSFVFIPGKGLSLISSQVSYDFDAYMHIFEVS